MTSNQIEFAKLQETKRHNLRTEGQTDVSISESMRHNLAGERINWYSAEQSAEIGHANVAESVRHNKEVERQDAPVKEGQAAYNSWRAVTEQYSSKIRGFEYVQQPVNTGFKWIDNLIPG